MADDIAEKRHRSKKKKSSLLTWKKKFNIKKRFSNKLPLHRRHIRSLMSGWSLNEIKSVLMQYEISSMLRELSIMADKSRPPAPTLKQDLLSMYKSSACCDMVLTCCEKVESQCMLLHNAGTSHKEFKVHRALVAARWPYLHEVIKEQTGNSGTISYLATGTPTSPKSSAERISCGSQVDLNLMTWNILINGLSALTLSEILTEIYDGSAHEVSLQTSPRKLLPLPTTDDSLHIRNSRRTKQHFRYTIFECEQAPVPRRRSGIRRKHKHRFSMDERILSNRHTSSSSSTHRGKSIDPDLNSGLLCQNEFTHLSFESPHSKAPGKISIPASLHDDMMRMYRDAKSGSGDLRLVISNDSRHWTAMYDQKEDVLHCHKFVLAARSPYFKKLIEKQVATASDADIRNAVQTLEIDSNVIPAKWMSAILYTMYTDKIYFFNLTERIVQGVPINNHLFNTEDAIALHHIGKFIEFPTLIYGCEELIVSNLNERNLLRVLRWSSLPHGSDWVRRQVNNFIRDRFAELLGTDVLLKLTASQIIEVLRSDFVNASELDILKCALKWGEQELRRRIGDSEPNLLSHTGEGTGRSKTALTSRESLHSRIEDLHECTAPVLACVRTQHLLPADHEVFVNAVKRRVISRPPTDLLENVSDKDNGSRQWVKTRADFVPPRLFRPYAEEAKTILDERYAQESDRVNLRSMHNLSPDSPWNSLGRQPDLPCRGVPDTLYMVGHSRAPTRRRYGNRDLHLNFMQQRADAQKTEPTKFMGNYHPVPDISVVRDLIGREREMRACRLVNRVLSSCADCRHNNGSGFAVVSYAGRSSIPQTDVGPSHEDLDEMEHCNRCTALKLVRLQVVRERGLPDCTLDVLQHPETYYTLSELRGVTVTDTTRHDCKDDRPMSPDCDPTREKYSELYADASGKNLRPGIQRGDSWFGGAERSTIGLGQAFTHDDSASSTDSSSSDADTSILQRRKKRTKSRRGSSSAASHQSIPDVAASADSSLRRLRVTLDRPALETDFSEYAASKCCVGGHGRGYRDDETCESLSFEENTSENEFESAEAVRLKPRRPGRPISADVSELFDSLRFADDVSVGGASESRKSSFSAVPELVRDGAVSLSRREKPDIYPRDREAECGRYFLQTRRRANAEESRAVGGRRRFRANSHDADAFDNDTIFL